MANQSTASRRRFLQSLGGFGALALSSCNGSTTDGATSGGGSSSSSGSSSGTVTGSTEVDATKLAVGSGAFFEGKEYGDPFTGGAGTTCTAYKNATKGPCHSNTFDRKDVSDGLVGLPTRFELLVVDADCNPIPDAIVEVWYASPAGTYSKAGEAADLNVPFCTGNDADALASNWLRGYQTTDANGRTTIDGIFPGWYQGRTSHVHFTVTANGSTSVTSQLSFDEALTTAVYTKHGSYSARGDKDTTNAKDNVFGSLSTEEAMMSFAQQEDGAVVCWKAITLA